MLAHRVKLDVNLRKTIIGRQNIWEVGIDPIARLGLQFNIVPYGVNCREIFESFLADRDTSAAAV